jgi:hypothetical protein
MTRVPGAAWDDEVAAVREHCIKNGLVTLVSYNGFSLDAWCYGSKLALDKSDLISAEARYFSGVNTPSVRA